MSDIARLIHESGKSLLRHWPLIAPHLDLQGSNLVAAEPEGPLALLLDAGGGVDFFVAYRGGRGIGGIATRAQWAGVYRTLTWRNRSTGSELARCCRAYLAQDTRVRPDWCVHLYEDKESHKLWGFVAAHADDLARYLLNGSLVGNAENHSDGTPFTTFGVVDLQANGVAVSEWWAKDMIPGQPMLGSTYRLL